MNNVAAHGGERQRRDCALQDIAHQLKRIGDALNTPGALQVTREEALKAWGLRIYEEDFLDALSRLGVDVE